MKVLVVVGNDLRVNSSANLCHKAYIQGLTDLGYSVDLLTAGDKKEIVRSGLVMEYRYPMQSLYELLGTTVKKLRPEKKSEPASANVTQEKPSEHAEKEGILRKIKREVHRLYGPYEVYSAWKNRAMAFRNSEAYDFVISLSFPPVSHFLAGELLKKEHITTKKWIQLWEDPWCSDLVFKSLNDEKAIKRAEKEERSLLMAADEIVYVSPLTLAAQKKMFVESAAKMRWYPVPTYYMNETKTSEKEENVYGYYGDYLTSIRNLDPFYCASKEEDIRVNICGLSDHPFSSTDKIHVRPRISLQELKPLEDDTNILVFLCNLRGGQIPGKIYQYSATDKTILFILDGTEKEKKILREFFGKFNRYVFCENNVEDIRRAIRQIEENQLEGVSNRILDDFLPKKIAADITDRGIL